jgi:uncharacterized Zn finger protein
MPKVKPPQWNAWAWRWLDALDSLGPAYIGRLQRARSYARHGHVWRLSVHPGKMSAQVLGSYGYYTTTVRVPTLPDAAWAAVIARLVDAPLVVASLLAGALATELDTLFAAAGVSLVPTELEDFTWFCTCPDWEKPCKHALAVCYDFAAHLDTNPALLLTLRGQTIEGITTLLRERWADLASTTPAEEEVEAPRAGSAFYAAGPALDEFSVSLRPPDDVAALLRSIGKPPFASEREDPITPLAQVYPAMTEQALRVLGRAMPSGGAGSDGAAR